MGPYSRTVERALSRDISPDGSEIVLEQVQQHSDIVLLEIPRR